MKIALLAKRRQKKVSFRPAKKNSSEHVAITFSKEIARASEVVKERSRQYAEISAKAKDGILEPVDGILAGKRFSSKG